MLLFWEKQRFTTVLEPFVGQLHFLPSHVHLFSKLLGSSSQHTVYIGHEIFADLAFLSSLNARWNLIFDFLPRAIDATGVHPQGCLWATSSLITYQVQEKILVT